MILSRFYRAQTFVRIQYYTRLFMHEKAFFSTTLKLLPRSTLKLKLLPPNRFLQRNCAEAVRHPNTARRSKRKSLFVHPFVRNVNHVQFL